MIYRPPVDEETKTKAVAAYRAGNRSFNDIGREFGVTGTTIRVWTDREYARRRKDAINEARRVVPKPRDCER